MGPAKIDMENYTKKYCLTIYPTTIMFFGNYRISEIEEIVELHFNDGIYNVSKRFVDTYFIDPKRTTYDISRVTFVGMHDNIYWSPLQVQEITSVVSIKVYELYDLWNFLCNTPIIKIMITAFGDIFNVESQRYEKVQNVLMETLNLMPLKTHSAKPKKGMIDVSMDCFWITLRMSWPTILEDLMKHYKIDKIETRVEFYKQTFWAYLDQRNSM